MTVLSIVDDSCIVTALHRERSECVAVVIP